MNIKHRKKKQKFTLTKKQRAILIGSLLGDANLNKRGKDFRVLFKHSINQLPFLNWKRKQFNSITGMKVNIFEQKVKGKEYGFGQFVTLSHRSFTELRKVFYKGSKKIVPLNILEILKEPLSLAVWIMDDGARDNSGMTIQTHSFSKMGVKRLIKTILINFGICSNIRTNKKKSIIYIPKSQIRILKETVKDYILSEYKYKFPNPVETIRRDPVKGI